MHAQIIKPKSFCLNFHGWNFRRWCWYAKTANIKPCEIKVHTVYDHATLHPSPIKRKESPNMLESIMISVGGYPQLSWVTTLERGQWRRCGRRVSWPWCTRGWFLGKWTGCSITRGRACGCRHCCGRCSRCSHVFRSRHIFQRCRCTLSEVCHVPTIRWFHWFCLWALSDVILVAHDKLPVRQPHFKGHWTRWSDYTIWQPTLTRTEFAYMHLLFIFKIRSVSMIVSCFLLARLLDLHSGWQVGLDLVKPWSNTRWACSTVGCDSVSEQESTIATSEWLQIACTIKSSKDPRSIAKMVQVVCFANHLNNDAK